MELRNSCSPSSSLVVMSIIVSVVCMEYCVAGYTSYLFGDSLIDAGNNDYLLTLSKADSPPYGIDFAPSGGHPTGRFTNGRTISDIMGEALGAGSFPPPFLAPNSLADAFHTGVNYASGSAGILLETGSFFIGRIPLQEQVDYFKQTRANMVNMLGENATRLALEKAVFSIAIGSNDILNYIQPSIPFLGQDKPEPAIFQDFMVSNLTMHLKRLKELGAKRFVVVGVGPLGCIPFVQAIKLAWNHQCSDEVNQLIQGYNTKLRSQLKVLNQEMGAQAILVYANAYDIFKEIIQNYRHYGFENAADPCCGPFLCQGGREGNMCEDRTKYVFWDAYHPTEAANIIMAHKLLDGDLALSSPFNVRKLYHYRFK